jgi:thioredoxin reductase
VRGRAGLATGGVAYRRLDAAGVDELLGRGVRYGSAPGEATTCRDAGVIVVGGANSAAQAAPHLAEYAERVTMIVRADSLARRASQYLVTRIEAHDRIDARTSARLIRADGETHLEAVQISVPGGEETIAADAMFVIIGGEPLTSGLEEELRLDEAGYIMTGPDIVSDDRERWWPLERQPLFLESSQPGLFVAGDIRHGSTKRVTSAVGEGAMAIALVHAHLARLERERQHPEGSRVDPQNSPIHRLQRRQARRLPVVRRLRRHDRRRLGGGKVRDLALGPNEITGGPDGRDDARRRRARPRQSCSTVLRSGSQLADLDMLGFAEIMSGCPVHV